MATRTYKQAIESLNTLQSNAATIEAIRAAGPTQAEFAIPEMIEYLDRIGYKPEDLNKLNVVHITGTKGKGSTSAFTDSIVRHSMPQWNVGLYTSPHLVAVRERIRLNGAPITEEDFTRFFFEVWDKLEQNDQRKDPRTSPKPMYFRFLTLVAFHAFISLKVDATILEVGVGGTYDCTNLVPRPLVTGVTALGVDHVFVLGKTVGEIAWHKGGIFKEGVPAYTVEQPEEGMTVLKDRAQELKASHLAVVPANPALSDIPLGLAGQHQVQNASLAVALARGLFKHTAVELNKENSPDLLPPSFTTGLKLTQWPGRCQTVPDVSNTSLTWFLDGAHTTESLECCMKWFVSPGVGLHEASRRTRILVFNCTSGRSGGTFLGSMLGTASAQLKFFERAEEASTFFDEVIFCTNVTYADGHFKGDLTTHSISAADLNALKTQNELADAWSSLIPSFPRAKIHVVPSIEHAVNIVRQQRQETIPADILVAGSLHLVGGLIEVAGLSEVALGSLASRDTIAQK